MDRVNMQGSHCWQFSSISIKEQGHLCMENVCILDLQPRFQVRGLAFNTFITPGSQEYQILFFVTYE